MGKQNPDLCCATCFHWRELKPNGSLGRCQFDPPVPVLQSDGEATTIWPKTKPDDLCGKHLSGRASNTPDWSPRPSRPIDEQPF